MTNLPTEDGRDGEPLTGLKALRLGKKIVRVGFTWLQIIALMLFLSWPMYFFGRDPLGPHWEFWIFAMFMWPTFWVLSVGMWHDSALQGTEGPGSPNPTEERGGE